MTYSVYQHWDPLKVCLVGKTYSPEFYSFIKNDRVRSVMERIARETEEDYQKLVDLLESFGVKVFRPTLSDNHEDYLINGKILPPPMCPRDWTIMLGDKFYFKSQFVNTGGTDGFRPEYVPPADKIMWAEMLENVAGQGNTIINDIQVIDPPKDTDLLRWFNSATTTRIGRDLYFGTNKGWWNSDKVLDRFKGQALESLRKNYQTQFPDYRCHVIDTLGHADGTYSPVVPGLIISGYKVSTYADTYPGWEVLHIPKSSWDSIKPFLELKNKNRGKWWVPGQELNDEFTEFVESWIDNWIGYVEETTFDVNMLVIDQKNVACCQYNKEVFDKFSEYGITPHVVNFRHRYFWDGGLHCITSDIHREGTMQDYFPSRTIA
jgi:hypothetical protein